jgi:hypothetical protein
MTSKQWRLVLFIVLVFAIAAAVRGLHPPGEGWAR